MILLPVCSEHRAGLGRGRAVFERGVVGRNGVRSRSTSGHARLVAVVAIVTVSLVPSRTGADVEPTAAKQEELVGRSFELIHRPIDEAYQLIAPFLSQESEVRVVRAERRLDVRDSAEVIAQIAEVLREFDVPPVTVRVSIRLVKGELRRSVRDESEESGVPPSVRAMLGEKYNSFAALGHVDLDVREGGERTALLGDGNRFRVEVVLGAADLRQDTVRLERISLEHRLQGREGRSVYRPVFQFSEELRGGRTRVLFATPGARDRRALFLLLTVRIEPS